MLNDRKITDWTQPVSSLDDRPQMTAAALKAAFDSNTNQIKPAVNGMIDDLTGKGGAGNIGVDVIAGVTGTTVQAMLATLKTLIDLCDTSAESDDKLNLKADKTTTDKLVKTITLNADTGVFTIKTDDGTTTTIDTMLEKIPVNCYLDGQEFVLVLDDGTEQRADLSDFITGTEFTDSSTIDFSVTGSNVTATIKNGSITLSMLENTVMSTLQGYMTAAQTAASNAATSETNAGTYRDQAQSSATAAAASASEAGVKSTLSESWAVGGTGIRQGEDTNNSKYFAQQSANSAATAQGWSDSAMEQADAAAQSAANAAQSAADAEAISGGDFIPNSRKGVPNGVATLDSNGKLVMAQLPDDTEAIPVTLTAAGWTVSEPYTQTVDANGVLADEDAQMIIPVPEDDSSEAYYSAGVRCTAQAANSLTFTCDAKPDDDIALYAIVSSVGNTAGGGGTSGPVLPTPTTGDAGKVPTVNDAEDGYELKTPSGGGSGGDIPVTAEKAYAASVLELNHIATNQYVAQHNSVLFEASENTTLKVGSSNLIGNPYSVAINDSLSETVEYSEITDGYALDYNSDYTGKKNFTNQRFGFSANIVSGKTYTLRFYVDSSSVGNVYAHLTNDPTTLGNLIGSGNIRNGTTCQITFTADADYSYIRIPIQNLPASITKITLAEGTVPLEYGSGAASYTVNAGDKIWLDGVKGLNCVGTGSFYESPLAVVSFNGIATGDGTINSCATAKTWVNMGDSIWTFGASTGGIGNITDYMAALCGGKWHNIATGGTTMASRPGSYAGDYDALDFWQLADAIVEGDFTAAKAAAADLTSNLANVDNIDWSSVDYITVAYGTNDLAFGAEIDNAENLFDTATICGALRYGIKAISTQYPNIRFFVLGLIYRNADSVPVSKIVECNQALKAAADYVGAEYVAGYGINEGNRETFLYDGTHPNGAGKQRIAETLARRIHDVTYLGGEG